MDSTDVEDTLQGSSVDILVGNKTKLVEWLSSDLHILQHAHSDGIIDTRVYTRLINIVQPEDALIHLLDTITKKGEEASSQLLKLLKKTKIVNTYPQLKEWNSSFVLPGPSEPKITDSISVPGASATQAMTKTKHQPAPANQTDRPSHDGMTTHSNGFTGNYVTNVFYNTASTSNERSGVPLPALVNTLGAGFGVPKKQVMLYAKKMENKGLLFQARNNGIPSYKVPKGKKSVKKHDAAKKPKAAQESSKMVKKPAVKKPAVKTPAVKTPAVKKPAAKKPTANTPAKKPAAKKPAKNSKKVTNIPKKSTKKSTVARKAPAKSKPKAVKPKKATSKKK